MEKDCQNPDKNAKVYVSGQNIKAATGKVSSLKRVEKYVNGMRKDRKVFFDYAKKRQKTFSKVGPFIDPSSGELNLDPDYAADRLSKQYSSVFNPPRPDWSISDMDDF